MRRFLTGPVGLALVVTLANALKPVVVDDTAYLAFARQVAADPHDPYGGTIFWYAAPEPKMGVLCPPVVPYWLGLGLTLTRPVGEHPWLLKLWLFPFVLLLAWALWSLLRRFARGTEPVTLPLLMLSPAVLPTVNLMLDVPASALGLTALAVFARAADRGSPRLAVAAGLAAALAMQTKYTALLVPPLLGWYGLTHRRVGLAALAVGAAVAAFAGWEATVAARYDGQSHFLYHLRDQQGVTAPGGADAGGRLAAWWREKEPLIAPLTAYLGCLGVGIGLYAGRAVGWPRWSLVAAAGLWAAGVAALAALPHHTTVLVPGREPGTAKLTLAALVWRSSGTAMLLTAAGCTLLLLARWRPRIGVRPTADGLFVVGWVLLELAGYFVLTPFPAARRLIGPTLALGVLAARAVSRVSRARPRRRPPAWVLPFGAAAGFLVAGVDAYDALPEKALAGQAAGRARERAPDARVWFHAHWGFQYYCEREGMRPYVPGASAVAPGDYLVLPAFPDDRDFYRPDSVNSLEGPPAELVLEVEAEFVWADRLSAQTLPNFYGGINPIVGRDHPRLRVVLYRVVGRR